MTASKKSDTSIARADEISVRTLLLKVIAYAKLVLRNWYWVVLGGLALGSYYFYSASTIIDTYPAKIKLFVSPPKVDKNNAATIEAFTRMMSTQKMLLNVLLKPTDSLNASSSIINTYLNTYFQLNPAGLPKEVPSDFQFKSLAVNSMSREERGVLNAVIAKANTPMADFSDGFVSLSGDYKLGFITINVSSPSEELSMLLIDELENEVKHVLAGTTGFANASAYSNLTQETDSLAQAYKRIYYNLNRYRDKRGRILTKQKEGEPLIKSDEAEAKYLEKEIHKLSADAEISKTKYLAALEQQKVAQLDRDQNAFGIETLERSIAPLLPFRPNAKIAGVKGGILGGIAVVALLVLLGILREIRNELTEK